MKTKQRKLGRKLLSFLLTLAMLVGMIPGTGITAQAASTELTAETTTWENGDYVVPEGGLTISGHITVNGTVNLTIPEGKTLTVNGGIDAGEYTVTVAGKGVLVVTGANGTEGTNGTSNGGAGSDGFKGNIIVDGATVTVTGGNGGNVTGSYVISGSNGGNGGNGVAGNITVNSGSATVTGGNGGTGGSGRHSGSSGSTGIAVTGTITGPTVEESADNSTWTKIESGASSTKKYIKVSAATAEVVKSKIDALPNADEVTIEDKTDIQKARDAYDALDDTEKDKIDEDTLKKLTDAESALAVAEVSAAINALPAATDVTTANKEAIEAARAAYEALTDEQKAKVSADTLKKLTDDESALAVAEVSAAINALPAATDVTTANKEAIDAAKAAYDALTDDQKKKVSDADKQKLNAAVAAIEAIEKYEAAAKAVSDKIAALPAKDAVTKDDKDAINAAKKAFDALTDDQKKKVSDADKQKLSDAVAAIEAIENDKADTAAAKAVSDKIAALPAKDAVTKDDKAAINAAKEAFDALTDDQKKMVSEADRQKLDDAVAALAAIDGEGNTPTPTPVPVANVSGNDTVSIKKLELNVKGSQTLSVGEEATIKAAVTGKGSDASLNSVNWVAPSGHVVVTEVQADGSLKVKAVGPGTAFVTAVCGGKAKTVKYTVKQPVNKAEASLNAITLSVKEKYRICVNLDAPTTDKFFYATNDTKVCTVNGKGIIAAKGGGTTTVDILAGEKKNTAKKVASITVTVKDGAAAADEVKDVSINYVGNKTLYTGEMAYISTLVNGGSNNGGQAVKYSFSAKGIVKIDAYGRLTAKKAGKVTVTASCGGKEASVELTVQQPLKTLKVNKTYVNVKQGKAKTVTLSVKTSPAQGKSDIKAVWSVANEGNGVKKISDENGKAVFEVSAAAKDTVVTATVTDPVTGKIYTVNSVIDVN